MPIRGIYTCVGKKLMKLQNYLLWISKICCGLTVGIGSLTLLGWLTGLRVLASVNCSYIPMAPNTAIAFITLGIAAIILQCPFLYRVFQWMSAILAASVIAMAVLTLLHNFKFSGFDINQAILKSPGELFSGQASGWLPVSRYYGKFHPGRNVALFAGDISRENASTKYCVVSCHGSDDGRRHCGVWILFQNAYPLRR